MSPPTPRIRSFSELTAARRQNLRRYIMRLSFLPACYARSALVTVAVIDFPAATQRAVAAAVASIGMPSVCCRPHARAARRHRRRPDVRTLFRIASQRVQLARAARNYGTKYGHNKERWWRRRRAGVAGKYTAPPGGARRP